MSSRPRAKLSKAQAIEIFHFKLAADALNQACPSSVHIGSLFGISEKTVRDIWKGRSWARATSSQDSARQGIMERGHGVQRTSTNYRTNGDSRNAGWNLGLLFDSRLAGIELSRVQESIILPTEAFRTNGCGKQNQPRNFRQNRGVVSGSVDYDLHEWSEGTLAPSELVDLFRLDWLEE